MSGRETWQNMVAVAKRAMRVTHPSKLFEQRRENTRTDRGQHVEDHYALLVAAGY